MYGSNIQTHYPARYIESGDRIFVRVSRNGQSLREFVVDNVSNFTDLIGEIRYASQYVEGLTQVFIRNYSRGWSLERPMKFYPVSLPRHRKAAAQKRRMLCPWETH